MRSIRADKAANLDRTCCLCFGVRRNIRAKRQGREKVAEMLRSSRNEVIAFCGHYHMDDETVDGNVRQYSTPAASYLIEKNAKSIVADKRAFGFRLIKIEGRKISTETVLLRRPFR